MWEWVGHKFTVWWNSIERLRGEFALSADEGKSHLYFAVDGEKQKPERCMQLRNQWARGRPLLSPASISACDVEHPPAVRPRQRAKEHGWALWFRVFFFPSAAAARGPSRVWQRTDGVCALTPDSHFRCPGPLTPLSVGDEGLCPRAAEAEKPALQVTPGAPAQIPKSPPCTILLMFIAAAPRPAFRYTLALC